MMILQELEVSLHFAFVEARQQRHEFFTVEHLLLILLDNPSAAEVLHACAANIDDLRNTLSKFIKENTPTVGGSDEVETQPASDFRKVILNSFLQVQINGSGSGNEEVTGANVLLSIYSARGRSVEFLHQQGVTRLEVFNFMTLGIRKQKPPEKAMNP